MFSLACFVLPCLSRKENAECSIFALFLSYGFPPPTSVDFRTTRHYIMRVYIICMCVSVCALQDAKLSKRPVFFLFSICRIETGGKISCSHAIVLLFFWPPTVSSPFPSCPCAYKEMTDGFPKDKKGERKGRAYSPCAKQVSFGVFRPSRNQMPINSGIRRVHDEREGERRKRLMCIDCPAFARPSRRRASPSSPAFGPWRGTGRQERGGRRRR